LLKSILPALVLLIGVGIWVLLKSSFHETIFSSSSSEESAEDKVPVTPIDWKLLRQLDWKTGNKTPAIEKLEGVRVRIPGYVVPLEDNQLLVKEFLFVPTVQACIHVPPPPPNQMIYVVMDKAFELNWSFRAFWLEGILSLQEKKSPYGRVSYQMEGKKVEAYRKQQF
jgi:uncharacterized protein